MHHQFLLLPSLIISRFPSSTRLRQADKDRVNMFVMYVSVPPCLQKHGVTSVCFLMLFIRPTTKRETRRVSLWGGSVSWPASYIFPLLMMQCGHLQAARGCLETSPAYEENCIRKRLIQFLLQCVLRRRSTRKQSIDLLESKHGEAHLWNFVLEDSFPAQQKTHKVTDEWLIKLIKYYIFHCFSSQKGHQICLYMRESVG